jgi:hypothetical protein
LTFTSDKKFEKKLPSAGLGNKRCTWVEARQEPQRRLDQPRGEQEQEQSKRAIATSSPKNKNHANSEKQEFTN